MKQPFKSPFFQQLANGHPDAYVEVRRRMRMSAISLRLTRTGLLRALAAADVFVVVLLVGSSYAQTVTSKSHEPKEDHHDLTRHRTTRAFFRAIIYYDNYRYNALNFSY